MPLDSTPGPSVAVVIPHFQRERGVLARALESILRQDYGGRVEVIVVDDGSPVPAHEEMRGLPTRPGIRIRIIEQENARCAAGRNRGLDAAAPGVQYFALLDADDSWSPDHLSRAVEALDRGHDFYFSNWMPLGGEQDAQSLLGRIDFSAHRRVDWADDMWSFRGDFFRQELEKPVGRVSTTVWRRAVFDDIRFYAGFTNCCEDIYFRLEIAKRNPSVVFSTRVEMFAGEGVNTFSASSWGTPGFFDVARDQLEFAARIACNFDLTSEERTILRRKRNETRRDTAANFLSLIRRGELPPARVLRSLTAADSGLLMALPAAALRAVMNRSRSQP